MVSPLLTSPSFLGRVVQTAQAMDAVGPLVRGPKYKGYLVAQDRVRSIGSQEAHQVFMFQYNPSSLRISRTLEYGHLGSPGTDVPTMFFVKAEPDALSFTLLFEAKTYDTAAELKKKQEVGVLPSLYALLALTFSNETLRPGTGVQAFTPRYPPRLIFSLGRSFVLPVALTSVDIQIQEWNANMVPVRASADVELRSRGVDSFLLSWLREVDNMANEHMEASGASASDEFKAGSFAGAKVS